MPLPLANASFLGFHVTAWILLGLAGNLFFLSRFIVQWVASERRKAVVIPIAFWWLSIVGSLLQGLYFILKPNPETGEADPDLVGILANVFNSIIYLRNLQLIRKQGLAASSGSVPMGGLEKPESSVGGQPTGGR